MAKHAVDEEDRSEAERAQAEMSDPGDTTQLKQLDVAGPKPE